MDGDWSENIDNKPQELASFFSKRMMKEEMLNERFH